MCNLYLLFNLKTMVAVYLMEATIPTRKRDRAHARWHSTTPWERVAVYEESRVYIEC